MAYFHDLSEYEYLEAVARPGTINVGWLEGGRNFSRGVSSPEFVNRLWSHCAISIGQTRGLHECDLCQPTALIVAEHSGGRLLLGSAEMRAFGDRGTVFAAPDLIFHYVTVHEYRPPSSFIEAIEKGPVPGDQAFIDGIQSLGLEQRPKAFQTADVRRVPRPPDRR